MLDVGVASCEDPVVPTVLFVVGVFVPCAVPFDVGCVVGEGIGAFGGAGDVSVGSSEEACFRRAGGHR